VWQALHEELKGDGFTVITLAEDRSADDAREWIEKASPAHPSLIDVNHLVADLYNMVNVPTVVWIDERGRIVRPNDVTFGSDMFKAFHHIESDAHKDALRAWVRGDAPAMSEAEVRRHQVKPRTEDQLARAEFALGFWLSQRGDAEAAERHFVRGGELAPHDFMICRGSMPIRGINSMGPVFMQMVQEWQAAGHEYYLPIEESNPRE
jgi:hypothetical protein